jgi:hypothetical protein
MRAGLPMAITFQRGLNLHVRVERPKVARKSADCREKSIEMVEPAGNKTPLLPRRHTGEPTMLRHCREAT